MKSIIVGEVEITAVTDIEVPFFRLNQLSPGVRTEQASFTRAQLLDWLEADGIRVAADSAFYLEEIKGARRK